ncbi:MAG: hypothetical protein KAS59_08890 [Alphaproteobacteria bacterium]|nr:hypothetical protein [Alphaproteobacteria bacterium]
MLSSKKHAEAGKSIFMSSMIGLANVLAVIATFFGTAPLYTATQDWVYDFALSHYGQGSADFMKLIWGVLCAALIFFSARASISTALIFGALAVMIRFF